MLKLIALDGVVEIVGEIGEQVEIVVKAVNGDLRLRFFTLTMPFGLQTVPLRMASVGRVQSAEETNKRRCGNRYLIAGIPLSVVTAGRDAETFGFVPLAVGQQAVEFGITVRIFPRPIVVIRFSAIEQTALTELLRYTEYCAPIAIHSAFQLEEILGQRFEEFQMGRSG